MSESRLNARSHRAPAQAHAMLAAADQPVLRAEAW
jgi:hypothetical protein